MALATPHRQLIGCAENGSMADVEQASPLSKPSIIKVTGCFVNLGTYVKGLAKGIVRQEGEPRGESLLQLHKASVVGRVPIRLRRTNRISPQGKGPPAQNRSGLRRVGVQRGLIALAIVHHPSSL